MNPKSLFTKLRVLFGPLSQSQVDAINMELKPTDPLPPCPPDIDPALFASLRSHLEREEGKLPHAYQDHLGFWTIGIGRLIDKRRGGRLTDDEIDYLLANDIKRCIASVEDWPAWQAVRDDPVRATGFLSMRFQMGEAGLGKFKNSLRLIAEKRWSSAAANLRASLWAKQTPARSTRVIAMIEHGSRA